MVEIDTVPLDSVRINGGTQSRAELSQSTIADYAEAIRLAVELPPVVMFFDGAHFWLADGFHRFHAHREAGAIEIAAEIRVGTQRDAVLFSVGANASHGLRRSNEDKRKAVETLLNDPEWATWSNNAIAKACAVSDKTVATYRAEYLRNSGDEGSGNTARTVERNGKTYQMDTTKIGSAGAQPAPAAVTPPAIPPAETNTAPAVVAPEGSPMTVTSIPSGQHQKIEMDPHPAAEENLVPASEVEQLREQIAELSEHLRTTLADNEMMGRVFDADDRIKAAMDEAARQRAIAENAERTLAAKSGEFIERARAVTHWKNRAEKAEKALAKLQVSA
jgi:hypothetical protein